MTETTIQPDSLVTLHYRVAMPAVGGDEAVEEELVSTFGSTPATLQMGNGELAPTLEKCVIGTAVGERRTFLLEPDQAFGKHNPQLLQRMPRTEIPASIGPNAPELHATIEFSAPSGQKFTGIVREMDAEAVLVDFNHPLAGRNVRFEVHIIGVM